MIHRVRNLYSPGVMTSADGRHYVFAVTEPWRHRLADAWAILTGKAYAFAWPQAGEIEDALGIEPWDRVAAMRQFPQAQQASPTLSKMLGDKGSMG